MSVPLRIWDGSGLLEFEPQVLSQMQKLCQMPFVHHHAALMPDGHLGIGAAVGAVIPTLNAVIPAAVGVDLGCGMMAVQTDMTSQDLPTNLSRLRSDIEKVVPHGRSEGGRAGDQGAHKGLPKVVEQRWSNELAEGFKAICEKNPVLEKGNLYNHLGTLGTGNHFIEICLDEADRVWFMLHSGSRGVGNRIGQHFISLAKEEVLKQGLDLPDKDLAYFTTNQTQFADYVEAVSWAQEFARINREIMMDALIGAVRAHVRPFTLTRHAINCHHNYVQLEHHFGQDVWVTRKGAVRAGKGELGITPGSMGAKSFIVAGKGNPESFCSCSHGAGRAMSRAEAKRRFTLADHVAATAGVECRKDEGVIDETPKAYKDIDLVMKAQEDLVEVVHTLKQILCVKG